MGGCRCKGAGYGGEETAVSEKADEAAGRTSAASGRLGWSGSRASSEEPRLAATVNERRGSRE